MAAASLPVLPSAHASSSEAEIFSLVNGGRSSKLTSDSGLQAAARAHARQIAADGNLTSSDHGGAASRIGNAAPSGYTGTYCENLGYTNHHDVAGTIYNGWRDSATHNACMHDSRMTVAGVGIYNDGQFSWVVMEFAQVRQSSSSNNPPPQPAVPVSTPRPQAPKATPRPQAAAPVADEPGENEEETAQSTPSPTPTLMATPDPEATRNDVQALTEEAPIPPNDPVLGTREYAALGALLAFAGLVFFLARRRV
jgi:hypothetical protein